MRWEQKGHFQEGSCWRMGFLEMRETVFLVICIKRASFSASNTKAALEAESWRTTQVGRLHVSVAGCDSNQLGWCIPGLPGEW